MAEIVSKFRREFLGSNCLVPELNMVGYDQFPKATATLAAHVHPSAYEICYLISGSVEWWAGDEVTEVSPGDVYVTRPNERHGGTDAFMHPCELLWIQVAFPLAGLAESDALALQRGFGDIKLRAFPASPDVRDCIEQILDEHTTRGPMAALVVRSTIHRMMAHVLRAHAVATQHDNRRRSAVIVDAIRWMDAHTSEDYAIDKVAGAVGLKPSRFHERFAAETGFTPAEFRTRQRLRSAKQMLRSTEDTVTDIAFSLGFATSQYFATVFKNHVGMTPREYRERTRGE